MLGVEDAHATSVFVTCDADTLSHSEWIAMNWRKQNLVVAHCTRVVCQRQVSLVLLCKLELVHLLMTGQKYSFVLILGRSLS